MAPIISLFTQLLSLKADRIVVSMVHSWGRYCSAVHTLAQDGRRRRSGEAGNRWEETKTQPDGRQYGTVLGKVPVCWAYLRSRWEGAGATER